MQILFSLEDQIGFQNVMIVNPVLFPQSPELNCNNSFLLTPDHGRVTNSYD
jgi:hypothetical protein